MTRIQVDLVAPQEKEMEWKVECDKQKRSERKDAFNDNLERF